MGSKQIFFILVFIFSQLYFSPSVYSENLGEWAHVEEPEKIDDELEINLEPGSLEEAYGSGNLVVSIFHEGVLSKEDVFVFGEGSGHIPSVVYELNTSGSYTVVLEVLDETGDVVDDYTESFDVLGSMGPFDFEFRSVSDRVEPDERAIFRYSFENLGTDALDVLLEAKILCDEETYNTSREFYAGSRENIEGYVALDTCSRTGIKEVMASTYFTESALTESSSKVEVTESKESLYIDMPERIEVSEDGNGVLKVKLNNTGDTSIRDSSPVLYGIDPEFYTVQPSSIGVLDPGDKALFVFDISMDEGTEGDNATLFLNTEDSLHSEYFSIDVVSREEEAGYADDHIFSHGLFEFTVLSVSAFILVASVFVFWKMNKTMKMKTIRKEKMNKLKEDLGV